MKYKMGIRGCNNCNDPNDRVSVRQYDRNHFEKTMEKVTNIITHKYGYAFRLLPDDYCKAIEIARDEEELELGIRTVKL